MQKEIISLIASTYDTNKVSNLAYAIQERMKQICPSVTGNLARSITIDLNATPFFEDKIIFGFVLTMLDYGFDVEYGNDKIEPKPFIRPTLDEFAEEINKMNKPSKFSWRTMFSWRTILDPF